MSIEEFINILCQTDNTGGLKLKVDATGNDLSDILTTSDPVFGRRVKVDVSGITSVIESPFNPIDSPISVGDTYQQAFEKAQGQIDAIDTIINGLVPDTRTLTINGTSYDLSADRTWSVGTVTSVGANSPITSSGGTTPTISTSMNTNKLIGRSSAGTGVMEEITVGTGLSLSAGTLSSTAGGLKSGIATAAVTDVYTTTITGVTSYTTNDAYVIKFNTANSDGATLNINSLGAVQLVKNNNVIITGGDISVGQEFIIIYDGTNFQMIGIVPNQMFAYVTNADSVTINKGQPVYAFGASGDRMSVKLSNNSSEATSSKTVGLVFSSSIAPGGIGFVITQGVISNVNTAAYTAGDTLYVGSTAGSLTNVLPYAPNHYTRIGIVERANAGNGLIYVVVQNGFQLDELSDVNLITTPPVNADVLTYNGTTGLWIPRTNINVASKLFNYYNFT